MYIDYTYICSLYSWSQVRVNDRSSRRQRAQSTILLLVCFSYILLSFPSHSHILSFSTYHLVSRVSWWKTLDPNAGQARETIAFYRARDRSNPLRSFLSLLATSLVLFVDILFSTSIETTRGRHRSKCLIRRQLICRSSLLSFARSNCHPKCSANIALGFSGLLLRVVEAWWFYLQPQGNFGKCHGKRGFLRCFFFRGWSLSDNWFSIHFKRK